MKTLDQVIKELYDKSDKKYDYDFFREVCKYPWLYLRDHIRSGSERRVRFMYFGAFKIMKKYVPEEIERCIAYYKDSGIEKYYLNAKNLIKTLNDTQRRQYSEELSRAKESINQDR